MMNKRKDYSHFLAVVRATSALPGFCFEVLTCHHVIRDCIKQNDRLGPNGGCGSGIAVTCDEAVCQLGERIIFQAFAWTEEALKSSIHRSIASSNQNAGTTLKLTCNLSSCQSQMLPATECHRESSLLLVSLNS